MTIIGNLTSDPQTREVNTANGQSTVCSFTVAVNKRKANAEHPEADYFRVSAWRQLGENCQKYLAKGRKVAVVGSVSVRTNESNGKTYANLEVQAEDVEFLSPREQEAAPQTAKQPKTVKGTMFTEVDGNDLPF